MTRRNLRAGSKSMSGLGLNILTEDDLYAIHCATLDVLHHTGIKVESREARELFEGRGGIVDHNNKIVKLPPYLVEDCIHSAPSTVLLAGRKSAKDFIIEGNRVGFVNFGEGVNVIDPFTKDYRRSTKEDVANAALLSDYLEELDISYRAVAAQDVSPKVQSLHNAEALFLNTSKHFFIGADNLANCRKLIEMASVIVGGKDKLKQRPIISFNVCPTSPLQLIPDCTEVIIEGARAGIPSNIISMALAGATSPVTLAGTLVTHNAEVLSAIVLSQLACKGAPVLYGSSTTIMDLKYTTSPVGAPELGLISAGVARLAQYYLLPSFVAGG
ncbi:MAG: trimethylamine methyltransferase family protein [Clostridia bacterium]|nr:trimethylamine methyltransferase family protein [Clostridia bacterium]